MNDFHSKKNHCRGRSPSRPSHLTFRRGPPAKSSLTGRRRFHLLFFQNELDFLSRWGKMMTHIQHLDLTLTLRSAHLVAALNINLEMTASNDLIFYLHRNLYNISAQKKSQVQRCQDHWNFFSFISFQLFKMFQCYFNKKKILISGEEKPRPESLLFCILVVLFGICLKIRKYEPLRFLFEQI